MSCCDKQTTKKHVICSACGQTALPVSRQTMLHQVQYPDNMSMLEGDYAFCANRDCNSGYFSASNMIPKISLRAFQSNQDVMLCHCFDVSESDYRTALQHGSSEAIKAFVVQQTKDKLCACESRNPAGRCCLASFKQMEKAYDS